MQAMRYDITLPSDYDMAIIRKRVQNTGYLMDHFPGLFFKVYLINEKQEGAFCNSYSPLYIWKDTKGMNQFIFDGYFDNIIQSFGWQNIEIGITSSVELAKNFKQSRYVTEGIFNILPSLSLKHSMTKETLTTNETGKVVIYNPDKWKKTIFTFYEKKPQTLCRCFEILHISS
ncbi:DUF4865 family protein [Streptococcus mutans]|nr:DUF4865 family protein [Streptococcus mutans]MCB4996734.1 DUF4865 family protein [Streptococcus mutans]MCB5064851.1 DUF4865 family protein [Streptococcus mutans]MCB5120919.1 DUF4865 family protein [Streptococcus mutans]MCB5133968.1 DUF4865 family protein [Streptococcus mutans]